MSRDCNTIQPTKIQHQNEKITLVVVIITLTTMIVEIVTGLLSGSMALLSDGIHMGTHAIALFITLLAYIFARKQSDNPKFSFGTGKVGALGAYTNSILLIIAALGMGYESIERIIFPVDILFNEAIIVAVVGLIVNIFCAVLMSKGASNHGHDHHHAHDHHHHDQNLKAAYIHIITDAFTSVLAIFALVTGKWFGLIWADPVVGILGAIVIIKWAFGLIRQSGSILLDVGDHLSDIAAIKSHFEEIDVQIRDIHIWAISENERSLVISLTSKINRTVDEYRQEINSVSKFDHVTIEIH